MISDGSDDVAFKVNGDQIFKDKILASSLINREMTKIGQAAWLCGSLPLGCMITYLEKFLFASLIYVSMLSLVGRRLLIPTVGDIHSIHSSEMSGRSCEGRVARRSC